MLETEKIEKVYSKYSRFYDLIFGRVWNDSRAAALKFLEFKPGFHILEVGVGTGLCLPLYPRKVPGTFFSGYYPIRLL